MRLLAGLELLNVPLPSIDELAPIDWADWPTRHVLFTGKGGVGKTTTACGVAVALASAGVRTLLISTDPASNLDDVFGLTAGREPTEAPDLPSLWLVNINPEQAAAQYRERTLAPYELGQLGVNNQQLVINGVLRNAASDPTARAFAERQQLALAHAPAVLRELPTRAVDLIAGDITGIPALEQLVSAKLAADICPEPSASIVFDELETLIDDLDAAGQGIVLTMGKGGVGKTTIAAVIAVALADRGHQVALSTTDPAAHITQALADEKPARLNIERIDPEAETARYSTEVLQAAVGLDVGRTLLEEDLRSPCTEEIAVFRAFARTVDQAQDCIVVLDTAPTDHTLLLLDAAESYQREIKRTNAQVPDAVRKLAQRLRDPDFARVIIMTLAESTPVLEAQRLQTDLRRAGIEPYGWLVNASLLETGTNHPILRVRAAAERPHLARIRRLSTVRTWSVAWQQRPDRNEGTKKARGAHARGHVIRRVADQRFQATSDDRFARGCGSHRLLVGGCWS